MSSHTLAVADSPSLGRRIASWALRGGLAGLIVWLTVWSLQGISAFVKPVTATQPSARPQFNPLQLAEGLDLTAGAWQFLDDGGDISAAALSAPDAQKRILTPPVVSASSGSRDLSGPFQDMLHIMRLQGEVQSVSGLWRFSLKQMGFHVVAFTRDQTGRELVAIRWLIPLGNDKFWLVEQTPSKRGLPPIADVETIVPNSISSRVLATRSDSSGTQICQLIMVDSSLTELLEQLRHEAWQIEAPVAESRPGFATIYLSRQSASYWMLASTVPDATSLRILLLKDGASLDAQSN